MIGDRETMPYLDGRVSLLNKRLPYDALITENLSGPNVYHYAPIGFKSLIKFVYRVRKYTDLVDKKVDDAINRFIVDNHIHVDKREVEMAVSNENVVDNGATRALIAKVRLLFYILYIHLFSLSYN
jgi:hypothetical protein